MSRFIIKILKTFSLCFIYICTSWTWYLNPTEDDGFIFICLLLTFNGGHVLFLFYTVWNFCYLSFILSEWVIIVLMPIDQFFSHIIASTSFWIFILLSYRQTWQRWEQFPIIIVDLYFWHKLLHQNPHVIPIKKSYPWYHFRVRVIDHWSTSQFIIGNYALFVS